MGKSGECEDITISGQLVATAGPKTMISSINIFKTHSNIQMAGLPESNGWQLSHLGSRRLPTDGYN